MSWPEAGRWRKARPNKYGPTWRRSKPIWAFTARGRPRMLSIENVRSAYGRIEVLHGVTLHVDAGEIVTLIGANGAGKTTLLHAISGVQPITEGAIRFEGVPIEKRPAHERVAFGISQVPEGRQVFAPLSVMDNLKLGAWSCRNADMEPVLARVCALFPMLDALLPTPAGALSG